MRAYPAYKPSGVEWFGNIPEGWVSGRLGYFASLQGGYAFSSDTFVDDGVPIVKMTNLNRGYLDFSNPTHVPRDYTNAQFALREGDLLLGMSGSVGETGSLGNFGRVREEDLPCFLNQRVGRFIVQQNVTDLDFLEYVLQARHFCEQILQSVTGTAQFNISSEQVQSFRMALPPLPEQRSIAAFLDREVAKIDGLIEEQRRLIALLAEKRQATISHAVTKGLNPHAKLKPSGIDWLGDVPEGWKVSQLRRFARLQGGYAFSSDIFVDEGIPIVKMTNLNRGHLDFSNPTFVALKDANPQFELNEGDLVWGMSGSVGETGSLGNFGRVRKGDLPCSLNQRVGRFVVQCDDLDLDFLEYVIQARYFCEQILQRVTGTAQFNISSEQVEACDVALPNLDEQRSIVVALRTELAKSRSLIDAAYNAVTLLQERRSALISAAVTGKIDVRDLAPDMMEPA